MIQLDQKNLDYIQKQLGHQFKDLKLLAHACTHPSADSQSTFERLEYLGDAVLDLVVSEEIFHSKTQAKPGELSKIRSIEVNADALCLKIKGLKIEKHVKFGASMQSVSTGVWADMMEAIIGALYLDLGYEGCKKIVLKHFNFDDDYESYDPKTALQEWTQGKYRLRPDYKHLGQTGPAHNPVFEVELQLDSKRLALGQGCSKKEAEASAATYALAQLKQKDKKSHLTQS